MQDFIRNNLYQRSIISFILYPLSLVYSLIMILRRKFRQQGYRPHCQIISVGNIVSGGSGKTPITIFLAKHLRQKGKKVAVSHRGYKGRFEKNNRLISDQDKVFDIAKFAGDEALLLASKLKGIPIIVGKNRKLSVKILEDKFPELDYIILDDSFQNFKVYHDFELVIFNESGGIGNGYILPAGILREPLSALKYCDQIIFNGGKQIPQKLEKYQQKIIFGKYEIKNIYDKNERSIDQNSLKNKKIALLSAIGQPASFEQTVTKAGFKFMQHFTFPDHFDYKHFDWELLKNFDLILTTEKDFAKLRFLQLDLNLLIIAIEFQLEDPGKQIFSRF